MKEKPIIAYVLTPPSINGERCRWLLRHFNIEYKLQQYTLTPQALMPALRYAGRTSGSKYVYVQGRESGRVFSDPALLLVYLNSLVEQNMRLQKFDNAVVNEINSLCDQYIRDWAYANFARQWSNFWQMMTHDVPLHRRISFYAIYPFLVVLFRLSFTSSQAKTAEAKLLRAADLADKLLEDGRIFINGEVFSYADIALCTGLAPMVLPPQYGENGRLPSVEALPPGMANSVLSMRQRPVGRYVLNIYSEHRLK